MKNDDRYLVKISEDEKGDMTMCEVLDRVEKKWSAYRKAIKNHKK